MKGCDRLPGQLRRDIISDTGETKNLDVQHFAGRLHGFKVLTAVMAQAQVKLAAVDRFPDGIVVPIELVANGRPDEVGPVGVKALLDQEINMAEIDIAEVNRDLLAVSGLWPKFVQVVRHPIIPSPSAWMVNGWRWQRVQALNLIFG
jgi:hypothetical protein